MIDLNGAFIWVGRLTLFSVFLQTLEISRLLPQLDTNGFWGWPTIRRQLEGPWSRHILKYIDFFYSPPYFGRWLEFRMLLCLIGLFVPHSSLYFFLFISNLAISFRWQGTFNGGSDAMTAHALLCLWLAQVFDGNLVAQKFVAAYFVFQVIMSYWVAGYVKLKNLDWWNGKIIQMGLTGGSYPTPFFFRSLALKSTLMKVSAFLVLIFELLFPLVLWSPTFCLVFLLSGFIFHLNNAVALGLNRFFWAWIATYPMLYYFATSMKQYLHFGIGS